MALGPSLLITGTFLWNLVAMEGEVRVFLHRWLQYLDIWYLLYSISMQSCADYLDSFHGCIRICLLDSGQSCLAVSHCSSALGWCLKRPQIAHIQFGIDIAAVDFMVAIVTVQSWRTVQWDVRSDWNRNKMYFHQYLRLDHRNSWSS